MLKGLALALALWIAGLYGWLYAHATVAAECRKIGSFVVGDTTYQCKTKENNDAAR